MSKIQTMQKNKIRDCFLRMAFFFVLIVGLSSASVLWAAESLPFSDDIAISVPTITSTAADTLDIAYTLSNASPFERTVSVAVYFQPTDIAADAYTHVARQNVTLPSSGTTETNTRIPAPNFLSGEYEIFIQVESSGGALLAQGHATLIALAATASFSVDGCSVGGVEIQTALADIEAGEALPELRCVIRSLSNDPRVRELTVRASLREYALTGREIGTVQASFALGGEKTGDITLPSLGKALAGPQILVIEAYDNQASFVATPWVTSLLISGNAAKVLKTKPDLTAYTAGMTAEISMDTLAYGPDRLNFTYTATLRDESGVCGTSEPTEWEYGKAKVLRVPIVKDCSDYTVMATVQDKTGSVLGSLSETFRRTVEARSSQVTKSQFSEIWRILVMLLVFVGILFLGGYLFWRFRHERLKMSASVRSLVFLLSGCMLFGLMSSQVEASYDATFVWGVHTRCPGPIELVMPEGDASAFITFDKTTYAPGETVHATATVSAAGIYGDDGGNGSARYWFDWSIPGVYTGSTISGTGLTTGATRSVSVNFAAPSTAGTYTTNGSLTLRSEIPGIIMQSCSSFLESSSTSGNYSFSVSSPYTLCGLVYSPATGCDTPFPVGETFSNLSLCQSELSRLLAGRSNNCIPPLSCQVGACTGIIPPQKPTVNLNGAISQSFSPLRDIAELITPTASAGGSGILRCAQQRLDLSWTSVNATSCQATSSCPSLSQFSSSVGPNGSVSIPRANLTACASPITFSMYCDGPGGRSGTDAYVLDIEPSCGGGPTNGACDNSRIGGCAAGSLRSGTPVTQIYDIVQWFCDGTNGGNSSGVCEYIACGSDNGQTLASVPTNLCSNGIPSAVSGSGPWSWTCTGSVASGIVKNCSAARAVTGSVCGNNIQEAGEACDDGDVNHGNGNGLCPNVCSSSCTMNVCSPTGSGTCGTAARNYANSESSYTGTFCEGGDVPNPSTPNFPGAGSTESWTCGMATCVASRDIPTGGYPSVTAVLRVDSGNPGFPATPQVQYPGLNATHRTATISSGESTKLVAQVNGGTYPRAWIFKGPTQIPPLEPTAHGILWGPEFGRATFGNGLPIEGTPVAPDWGIDISLRSDWPNGAGGKVHEFDTGVLTTDTTYRLMTWDQYSHSWHGADLTILVGVPPVPSLIVCPNPPVPVFRGGVPAILSAHYTVGVPQTCSGFRGTNVTESASWSSPGVYTSVSDTAGTKGRVQGVNVGTESVTATYAGLGANTSVTVTDPACASRCDINSPEAGNTCSGETYSIWNACLGQNETCSGVRSCDFNWKEVAP